MKKMLKVDAYDPQIYPRTLWVANRVEGLNKIFHFCRANGKDIVENAYKDLLNNSTGVLCTHAVIHKSTGKYGVLVMVMQPEEIVAGDEAHEAVHVADYIFEQLDMYSQDFSSANEQYAYLVGWAAGCISKTIINNKKYDTRRESDDVEA